MGTAYDHGIRRLYHFQGELKYLEGSLMGNHIYCSSPGDFNDPWDCKPYFDPSSVHDPDQREKWIEFFKETFAALPPSVQQRCLTQHGDKWFENTQLLEESIESTTRHVCERNAKHFRICCFSPKPNSLLMWAHYANKHKGVCLEFDATKEKLCEARRVHYSDVVPLANADLIRTPDLLLATSLLTKSTEWSYEQEYRLLARDGEFDPTFSLATEGNFLKLPEGAITAVIAGSRAELSTVRELIRRTAPGLSLKRTVCRPDGYVLDIVDDEVV